MKKTPLKALLRSFFFIALMLGVSLFLVRGNSVDIKEVILKLKWTDMVLLFFLSSLVTILQGTSLWKIVQLRHHSFALKDALQNVFISGFISVLFSTTFGKGAQFILLKSKNIPWETTGHIGLVDQLMYYIADIFVCGLSIFIYHDYFKEMLPSLWWVALLGLGITVLLFSGLILLYIPTVNKFVLKFSYFIKRKIKQNGKLDGLVDILISFVLEVQNSINKSSGNLWNYLEVIVLNMLKVLVRNGLMFVVIHCLNPSVLWQDLPIYFASACFLEMALNALPVYGDKGTAEIGFVLVFGALIGDVEATSAMLVWRFFSFYLNAVTGAVVLGLSPQIHLKELLNEQK